MSFSHPDIGYLPAWEASSPISLWFRFLNEFFSASGVAIFLSAVSQIGTRPRGGLGCICLPTVPFNMLKDRSPTKELFRVVVTGLRERGNIGAKQLEVGLRSEGYDPC